jgi:hypothetical protein
MNIQLRQGFRAEGTAGKCEATSAISAGCDSGDDACRARGRVTRIGVRRRHGHFLQCFDACAHGRSK